jgi:iron complex outermembrane recepter protein
MRDSTCVSIKRLCGAGLMMLAGANIATAQDAPAGGRDDLEEVIVTGSRVIQSGFQAPTPVTMVTAEQLQTTMPSTLADALNQLPIFNNSFKPASTGPGIVSNAGGAYLNARSLGANRNLVLLDGRRMVPSSVSGSVAGATDINIIPQSLVQRVDVVTGGASAAYGADAVSGVVNFVLDTRFTGLKGEAQGGISAQDDNKSGKASLAYGTPFASSKGHLLLSVEYYDNEGIKDFTDRDWAQHGYANIRTTAALPQTSLSNPTRMLAANVRPADRSVGGLVTSTVVGTGPGATPHPLAGRQFDANGQSVAFPYGTQRTATSMIGGGTDGDLGVFYPNVPGLERGHAFSRVSYDLSSNWTVYGEGLFATARSEYFGGYSSTNYTISNQNPYLSPADQALLGTTPTFTMGRINVDFGGREERSHNDTFRAVAGADGKFGDWDFKAYYAHGESRQSLVDGHNVIVANLTRAADAVVAPAGNPGGIAAGTITCRDLISATAATRAAAAGCVPINVLGPNKANAAALDYIIADNWQRQRIKQDVVDWFISGKPIDSGAGPVSLGAGMTYRKEQVTATADPIGTARGFEQSNMGPLAGDYDVTEVFVETLVPIVRDMPLARSIDFNGALRYADYSTSGGVTSSKIGLSYSATEELRFRATISRDVRAANLNELYSGPVSVRPPVTDPFRGSTSNPNVTTVSFGNENLKAEKGDTFTTGVIYQPSWLTGLSTSIDYYDIKITDTIGTLGGGQIVTQCFNGASQLCGLIIRGPLLPGDPYAVGPITQINNQVLNVGQAQVRGLDFEVGYRTPLWAGNLNVRLLATRVLEQSTRVQGALTLTDQVGRIGGAIPSGFGGSPKWTASLDLGYTINAFSVHLHERYLGAGVIDNTVNEDGTPRPANAARNANPTGNGLVPNRISAWYYTDATVKYKFGGDRRSEVFFTVNNLFDKDPAVIPSLFFYGTLATNAQIYDTVGRTYTAGVRFSF